MAKINSKDLFSMMQDKVGRDRLYSVTFMTPFDEQLDDIPEDGPNTSWCIEKLTRVGTEWNAECRGIESNGNHHVFTFQFPDQKIDLDSDGYAKIHSLTEAMRLYCQTVHPLTDSDVFNYLDKQG